MNFQLQYLLPPNIQAAPAEYDPKIVALGASLQGADTDKGAAIPNTPLTIRLNLMLNGAGIDFMYEGRLAYINFCCFENQFSESVFKVVESHYKQFGLGIPKKPTTPQWIHLVPVAGPMSDVQYSLLSQKLAVSFYWAAFSQIMKSNGKIKDISQSPGCSMVSKYYLKPGIPFYHGFIPFKNSNPATLVRGHLIPLYMKHSLLSDIIAFFFIFLFLYTGGIKLTEIHTFQQQLSSSPLMSSLSGIVAWALPITEILLAIALSIPKTRLRALYVTAGLMTFFTIYVIVILFIDDQLTCSCGGIIEELTPKQHVAFNSACVILAIIGILALRKKQHVRRFKMLTGSSAIALFSLVGWLLVSAFQAPVVQKTGLEGRLIPSIPLLLTDSSTWFKTDDIPTGKPFIVMGFSPWCIHCQILTVDIKQHMKDFKDVPIYYITPDRFKNMCIFYRFYKLSEYPNIKMGRDSANSLFHFFNTNKTPLIAIYDSKRRLKRVIPGQPTAAELAKIFDN